MCICRLSEAKERLADKVAELKLRNPNEDLLIKIRELETTCGSLKAALDEYVMSLLSVCLFHLAFAGHRNNVFYARGR
jgi:hypothetical protein